MKAQNIIIGIVSETDPFSDRKAWSGTIYKIREAIENAGFYVKWVKIGPSNRMKLVAKYWLKLLHGPKTKFGSSVLGAGLYGKSIDYITAKTCDYLFFPGGASAMNYINTCNKPYIYYADANFCDMVNYYWFISKWNEVQGNLNERIAIRNAWLNLRSSDWAKESAIKNYGADPQRVEVIEFGANIDNKFIEDQTIKSYKRGERINILFSGVDWNRKGGSIAVNTVKELRNMGIDAHLTIAGIKQLAKSYEELSFIHNLGFLNKNIPHEYIKYINTIKECHILLLPTKAECSAIIYCEASAYGLPIFTHQTGGVANYVIDGVNGYKLPIGSTPKDFALKIRSTIDNDELEKLSNGGIELYREKLNWEVWSKSFYRLMKYYVNRCSNK